MRHADSRVEAAYAACRRLARRHYENFPVASYLVGRDKRDALAAIYAFARSADDFADEVWHGHPSPAAAGSGQVLGRENRRPKSEVGATAGGLCHVEPDVRVQQLSDWRQKLGDCYLGHADHPVFVALSDAAR